MQQATHKYLVKLNRNNTNFTAELFEYFKNISATPVTIYSFLKYYQNIIRAYIEDVDIDSRGLLIYQAMGLGKSILAMAIALDLIKERQVILLLTKSLQENMRTSIHKYVSMRRQAEPDYYLGRFDKQELDVWIKANFSFVSMNASNMLKQLSRATEGHSADEFNAAIEKKFGELLKVSSLDGKLLIVDEAHNLFRAITNGSKNALGLYNLVMKAKNLKIIFLTGTPITNDPFELVPCFNMLGSTSGKMILPEDYFDFKKLFVDDNGGIKNKEKFQNRILGLVSYVSHLSTPGKAFNMNVATSTEFPEELPTIVERVPMDAKQWVVYQLAREREKEEGGGGSGQFAPGGIRIAESASMTKPKSGATSTYRVKSRQLSNYCPPIGFSEEKDVSAIPASCLGSPKYRKCYANIKTHMKAGGKSGIQLGLVYSQFIGMGGLGSFSQYLKSQGWQNVTAANLRSTGPRITLSEKTTDSINDVIDDINLYESVTDIDDVKVLDMAAGSRGNSRDKNTANAAAVKGLNRSLTSQDILAAFDSPATTANAANTDPSLDLPPDDEYTRTDEARDDEISGAVEGPGLPSMNVYLDNIDTESAKSSWWEGGNDSNSDDDYGGTGTGNDDYGGTGTDTGNGTSDYDDAGDYTDTGDYDISRMYTVKSSPKVSNSRRGGNRGDSSKTGGSKEKKPSHIKPARAVIQPAERQNYSFAIISGSVTAEDRHLIQDFFNSDENMHGGIIDLLLISSTGAEGLDLKNGRHLHILEPYWNWSRIAQISARFVRNRSHISLPKAEHTVQPYIYLSIAPETERDEIGGPATTDTDLYDRAMHNRLGIVTFDEAMQGASVECTANEGKNCRVCSPNNQALYTCDVARDVRGIDPCKGMQEVTVAAKEIIVDGISYWYTQDNSNIYGYKIFIHDTGINGYRQLRGSDDRYESIINAIKIGLKPPAVVDNTDNTDNTGKAKK